ncbi:MAG TPA: formate/nitrite family transporter [Planctomycetaceae bacterium]|nr:formate/nitrite family transporter [Planctomycetaceae bacterium]
MPSSAPAEPTTAGGGSLEALLPPHMARRAEEIGEAKARLDSASMFMLAVLAGAFIGLGAMLFITVTAGDGGQLPFGVLRLVGGVAFSLGLVLVVVGGAELFTGNNLIVMAWAAGRVETGQLLRNWAVVYVGNLVGAVLTAALVYWSGQHESGGGAVAERALAVGVAKCRLEFVQAVLLGVLCNALVCLAVWLTYSARTTTDRILAIVPPITAFVAAGFEHSVANMYFLPLALFIKYGSSEYVSGSGAAPALDELSWSNAAVANLLPVTLGNIIGGAILVGAVYWFVYLRDRPASYGS